jgi:hypothetical protein
MVKMAKKNATLIKLCNFAVYYIPNSLNAFFNNGIIDHR